MKNLILSIVLLSTIPQLSAQSFYTAIIGGPQINMLNTEDSGNDIEILSSPSGLLGIELGYEVNNGMATYASVDYSQNIYSIRAPQIDTKLDFIQNHTRLTLGLESPEVYGLSIFSEMAISYMTSSDIDARSSYLNREASDLSQTTHHALALGLRYETARISISARASKSYDYTTKMFVPSQTDTPGTLVTGKNQSLALILKARVF